MLTKDSHAYYYVACPKEGKGGFEVVIQEPNKGHGKSFGTMMNAVNERASTVLGLEGDPQPYPYYHYNNGEGIP